MRVRIHGQVQDWEPRSWYDPTTFPAGVAKLVNAVDSKSTGGNTPCRFESDSRHQLLVACSYTQTKLKRYS